VLPHFLRFLQAGYHASCFTRSLHARLLILSPLRDILSLADVADVFRIVRNVASGAS